MRREVFLWYTRAYFLLTTLISCLVVGWVYRYGAGPLRLLIYFKLVTTALAVYLTYRRRAPQRAFLRNCGVDDFRLLAVAVLVDLALSVGAVILAYAAR